MAKQRIVVGISGASGFQYGHTALRLLRQAADVETHLVVSKGAELTRGQETDLCREEVYALADAVYPVGNLAAPIASGSFQTLGMLVAPCSMRTLAAVAQGWGCRPERAAAAGVDGARNAAESGTSGQYAAGNGNGRHRVPARPRFLPQAAKRGRYFDPQRRPRLGIVRIGNPEPAPLGGVIRMMTEKQMKSEASNN